MLFIIYIIMNVFALLNCSSFSPLVHENKLKFPYGVNFKYNGMVHYNMGRVWIVTKIPLPSIGDLAFEEKSFLPDCDFTMNANTQKVWTDKYYYLSNWLTVMCKAASPQISLLQQKEEFYRHKLRNMLEKEIFTAIPALNSAGRTKRFAALIPVIAGLVTLAVESLNGYLQNKRNKAMANALAALEKSNERALNKLNRYDEDLLLYGEFSLKSTESIVNILDEMYSRQTFVEEIVANLTNDWPGRYLSKPAGAALYASHLSTYMNTISEKYLSLYRE